MKKYFPAALLVVAILVISLFMPSTEGIRVEPQRLTPTPEVTPSPTPAPTPTPAITPIPAPEEYTLRSESDSAYSYDDVKLIQARLRQLGFYGGEADGFYGRDTFIAVYSFQRMNGLETDGMAGEQTQRMLFESDTVKNSLGQVYVPFTAPTPSPSPTPSPTPRSLPMDAFSSGSAPNEKWFGETLYRDGTISASVETSDGDVTVKVSVQSPYQIRSAIAGTYELPQTLPLAKLSNLNKAVVAFAGTDYTTSNEYEMRQQLVLNKRFSGGRPLLVIDTSGNMRLYTPNAAENAAKSLAGRMYQALSVDAALIISGIPQAGLDNETDGRLLAFGQTGEGEYVIISAEKSPAEICQIMLDMNCKNAAIIGRGGVYTCFGGATKDTYKNEGNVSNIIYFASHIEEAAR